MSRFTRILASIAPSVPPALEARCHMTPAPGACGEAAPGAGDSPAAAGADTCPPAAAGQSPEGGAAPVPSPSGPPPVERHQSEPVHPSRRYLFEDRNLAGLLTLWSREQHA